MKSYIKVLLPAFACATLLVAGCDAADPAAPHAAAGPLANAAPRSGVCHYDPDADAYRLITVTDPALPAHLRHGDAEPGTNGLDEACQPVGGAFLAACLSYESFSNEYDLSIDTATGEFTASSEECAPAVCYPRSVTGDVTDPDGAVSDVGSIDAFVYTAISLEADQEGGGCDGASGSAVDRVDVSVIRGPDGTLMASGSRICDGAVVSTFEDRMMLTAGACPEALRPDSDLARASTASAAVDAARAEAQR